MNPPKKRLLDQAYDRLRLKNYAHSAEKSRARIANISEIYNKYLFSDIFYETHDSIYL